MTQLSEEYRPEWYPYEGGTTVGQIGPEGGYVLRDEEYGDPEDDEDADARLTLEQGRVDNPGFPVSATLYGWMFHAARYGSEAEAGAAYDAMRPELERMVEMLPYEEDGARRIEQKAAELAQAVVAFEQRFAPPPPPGTEKAAG